MYWAAIGIAFGISVSTSADAVRPGKSEHGAMSKRWHTSFESGRLVAREQNLPLFVVFR
jgi:hypothetical protein